ncbi:hypothetical protein HYS96_03845 [Candidatus Daviesbacteria bacterium]|nr:hypothetical protein [Candidatus Daviesbacteria bacterium]
MAKKSDSPVIIDTVQIALFPNEFKIQSASELQAELLSKGFIKSDKLIINTFPENFPQDVVRIDAQLNKYDVNIKIAPAKISLYWGNKAHDENFSINLEEVTKVLGEAYDLIKDLKDKTFNRVGYITTIYKKISNPETLIRKVLDVKNKNEIRDGKLVLTYNWKPSNAKWKNVRFNKHVTTGTGLANKDKAILIQYDLNTHQENKLQWQLANVQAFIKEASGISSRPNKVYSEFF